MIKIGKLHSVLAVGLALALSSPSLGQRTGTRINRNANAPHSVSNSGVDSAIIVTNGFGQCLARREGKSMRAVLDLPLLAADQRKGLENLMGQFDQCLGDSDEFDELRYSNLLVIGGAAEYFVGAELRKANLSSLVNMTDETLMDTEFRPRTELEDLGLCVVRRDVAKAQALLNSKPTSNAEKDAIKAIIPELGPCVSAGSELQLNAPNVRALIAFALYRAASKMEGSGT